jgi:hypothetical protein
MAGEVLWLKNERSGVFKQLVNDFCVAHRQHPAKQPDSFENRRFDGHIASVAVVALLHLFLQ